MARLFVGTSGFAYREWKPEFYPADLKQADFLRYYATRFPSVEINNTFYKTPSEQLLQKWTSETPDDFALTLKAPQRITHIARLRDVDEILSVFLGTARTLGSRLGAILFQLPPTLKYEPELLDAFLAALPGEPFRFAMEFRHASWDTDEVRDKLARTATAWCVAEDAGDEKPMVRTARTHVYMRLRKLDYSDDQLKVWAGRASEVLDDDADVYCYFKHEDDPTGIRFAIRFRELVETG